MEEVVKDIPRWRKNKFRYINRYNKEHYHRLTVQISNKGEEEDLWISIKDSESKNKALIELAKIGLRQIKAGKE